MRKTTAPAGRAQTAPSAGKRGTFRGWLLGGPLFLVSAVVAYFLVTALLRPTLPDSIVGDWRIEGGDLKGARFSFTRDGKFKAVLTVNGRPVEVDALVEKRDDTLRYTIVNPATGKKEIKVQTIKSLTEREMIVEENRQQSRLVRIGVATE
jgi:hypothetical protein